MPRKAARGDDGSQQTSNDRVLVAAMPGDEEADVHVARLDLDDLNGAAPVLVLRGATLKAGGGVELGESRMVSLANAADAKAVGAGEVKVTDKSGKVLVQLFLEGPEDAKFWVTTLSKAIELAAKHGTGEGDKVDEEADPEDEIIALKAKSQKLQARIADLEAVGQRRDKHLQKMLSRVEGAMQMLGAVSAMCDQQKKVIQAQRVAIAALRDDCGLPPGDEGGAQEQPVVEEPDEEVEVNDDDDDDGEDSEEVHKLEAELLAKTAQMNALMQQAMDMQSMLQHLESLQAEQQDASSLAAAEPKASPTARAKVEASATASAGSKVAAAGDVVSGESSPSQAVGGGARDIDPIVGDLDGATPEQISSVLTQLQALESEKARYESMLRDSQNEHESLLDRLSGMRALMQRLGMDTDGLLDDDDDEEGE